MSPEIQQPKPKDAICPHCKREPCTLAATMIMMGGLPWARVICADCRKIISVQLMPMPQGPPQPQQEPSRLILPTM